MIDELDKHIVVELQKDGRLSYVDLAAKVHATEGTIRKRLKSLKDENVIDIVAVPNYPKLGFDFAGIIGIQVNMRYVNEVAEILSKKPLVCQVAFVTGRFDLIVTVVAPSVEVFSRFMREELSAIQHVSRTETFLVLSMIKGSVNLPDTVGMVEGLPVSQ